MKISMLDKKQAVFTTKFVIEDNSPLTYVSHDNEGDWQFFSQEDANESDARIVSLEEMIDRDPTINQILNIPTGKAAYRNNISDEWIIINIK